MLRQSCSRWRRFFSTPPGEWYLWENVISKQDETALISELQPILERLEWNRDHFDKVIFNYRETMISDHEHYPHLTRFFTTNIKPLFDAANKIALPIHLLELDVGGYIKPHIDNLEASGSMIAGLSLNSDCTLRFTSSLNGECWQQKVPQRSLYLQRYALFKIIMTV